MELTYKETLFVNAYLGEANGNGSEAARIAGYNHPGQLAYRLLQKHSIRTAIAARVTKAAMSADEVLARITEFATGSLEPFVKIEGDKWSFSIVQGKKRGKLRLLKKLKTNDHGIEIEVHSPLDALDKLAKYHGLYVEKIKIDSSQDVADVQDFLADDPPKAKSKAKPKRKAP